MMGRRTYRRVRSQQHRFGRKHYRARSMGGRIWGNQRTQLFRPWRTSTTRKTNSSTMGMGATEKDKDMRAEISSKTRGGLIRERPLLPLLLQKVWQGEWKRALHPRATMMMLWNRTRSRMHWCQERRKLWKQLWAPTQWRIQWSFMSVQMSIR